MAELTKKDIIEILEPFATAIQEDAKKSKEEIMGQMLKMTDDMSYIRGSVSVLQEEIRDIKEKLNNVVYRHELENLRHRIEILEQKLEIKK